MNKFVKLKENVFLVESNTKYNKGDIITIEGDINKFIIFNFIYCRNNKYYYSVLEKKRDTLYHYLIKIVKLNLKAIYLSFKSV